MLFSKANLKRVLETLNVGGGGSGKVTGRGVRKSRFYSWLSC